MVDDEPIYIKSLESQIKSNDILSNLIEIQSFSQSECLIDLVKRQVHFDLAIIDVDYGPGRISGFQATEQFRLLGFQGKICIHSNRGTFEFQPKALELGANLFLPKPMANEHLLSLVMLTLPKKQDSKEFNGKIILFEDESIYQRQWKRVLGKDRLLIYKSWDEFTEDWKSFKDYGAIEYAITDYYLQGNYTGLEVAIKLRELGFTSPIFLSSNLDELDDNDMNKFSLKVSKDVTQAIDVDNNYFRDN